MINNVKERVGKRIFKGDIREQEKIKRVGAQKKEPREGETRRILNKA